MEQIFNPFHFQVDRMSKLLLIGFEKDPDSSYLGFEPQVFDDDENGQGHLVIGWRIDGKVDVYYQDSLRLDPRKYGITGKGLSSMVPTKFRKADFEIGAYGVKTSYVFHDLDGRLIQLEIAENHPKHREPFDLLAPMGHAAENPSALPLVFLFDFYFVRKKHTQITISIGGRNHTPDRLPFPLDGMSMFFARYSPLPFVCFFNPDFSGRLTPINLSEDDLTAIKDERRIFAAKTTSGLGIQKIEHMGTDIPLVVSFEPPFPCLSSLSSKAERRGRFTITSKRSAGQVGGIYTLYPDGDATQITMVPSDGWIPKPDRWMLRFLYAVAKPFKNWPRTYRWEAQIT